MPNFLHKKTADLFWFCGFSLLVSWPCLAEWISSILTLEYSCYKLQYESQSIQNPEQWFSGILLSIHWHTLMQCTLYFAVKIFFRHIPIEVLQAGNYIQIRMSIRAGMVREFTVDQKNAVRHLKFVASTLCDFQKYGILTQFNFGSILILEP